MWHLTDPSFLLTVVWKSFSLGIVRWIVSPRFHIPISAYTVLPFESLYPFLLFRVFCKVTLLLPCFYILALKHLILYTHSRESLLIVSLQCGQTTKSLPFSPILSSYITDWQWGQVASPVKYVKNQAKNSSSGKKFIRIQRLLVARIRIS